MRYIILLLLLMNGLSSFSQQMIKGVVVDDGKGALSDVNILLYSNTDTIRYLKGEASSVTGEFQFLDVKNGVYKLVVSRLGFEPEKRDVKVAGASVVLDTLVMTVAVNPLSEIIVKSNSLNVLGEKNVKLFSAKERDKSSSALELMLNIPQITFNMANNSLLNAKGKQILILCDGVKANEVDLMGLRPDDVLKAEYYSNPPLKYANTGYDAVLFVKTKPIKEKGGYLTARLENGVTTGFGTNILQGKYSSGSNDYMLRYFIDYRDLNKNKYSQAYSYSLDNGKDYYDIEKNGENGDYVGQYHKVEASFSRNKQDNYLFVAKTKLAINPGKENYPQLLSGVNANIPLAEELSTLYTKTNYLSPNLDLYFSKKMSHKQELSINVVNTYYNSYSDRTLKSTDYGIKTYLKGKSYSLITECEYVKHFGDNQLSVGVNYFYKTLRDHFNAGEEPSVVNDYSSHKLYAYINFVGQKNKFYYMLGFGGEQYWQKTNQDKSSFVYRPMASLTYKFNSKASLKLRSQIYSYIPDISLLTNNPVYIDSAFISIGNSGLKPYYKVINNLLYTYNVSSFYAEIGMNYIYMHKPYFPIFQNKEEWVQKIYSNIDNMHKTSGQLYLNWKPLSFLNISLYEELAYQSSRIEGNAYNNWHNLINVSVSAFYKDFTLSGLLIVQNSDLSGMLLEKAQNYYSIDLTWKKKSLSLTLGCLFSHDPTITQTCEGAPIFYRETKAWNNFKGLTYLQLVYTLPFGKEIKRSMKQRLNNEDRDAGIYIDNRTKM